MRAHLMITDGNGATFEGIVELSPASSPDRPVKGGRRARSRSVATLDFDLPMRAFVKNYAKGLSGPRKFVLLTAYLAKGEQRKEVALRDVERHWNRMTTGPLMGSKFNRFYSSAARENGWVETKKPGVCLLRKSWKDALERRGDEGTA